MRVKCVLFSIIPLLILGCVKRLKVAGGPETEVIVFSTNEAFDYIEEELTSALEREVFTPTKEEVFTIRHRLPSELMLFNRRRNILFAELVNTDMIDSVLSPEAKSQVMEGQSFVFGEQDIFAEGQSVLVISARSLDELREAVRTNKDVIFSFFFKSVLERIREVLYKDGYKEKLGERLFLSYNFTLDIPPGWAIDEYGRDRLLKIYRHYPDRFLTIYWEYNPRALLTFEDACELRDSICTQLHDSDKVDRERTRMFNVDFKNMNAQKLDGIWENDELVMGGPFRTYIFSTESAFYFIDIYVFAPGEKKWIPINQLETLVSTWREG